MVGACPRPAFLTSSYSPMLFSLAAANARHTRSLISRPKHQLLLIPRPAASSHLPFALSSRALSLHPLWLPLHFLSPLPHRRRPVFPPCWHVTPVSRAAGVFFEWLSLYHQQSFATLLFQQLSFILLPTLPRRARVWPALCSSRPSTHASALVRRWWW